MDDPLDAVAVHAGAGIVGIMAVPIFMEGGIIYGVTEENMNVLTWNAAGIADDAPRYRLLIFLIMSNGAGAGIIAGYNLVAGILMFGGLRICGLLRVDQVTELSLIHI